MARKRTKIKKTRKTVRKLVKKAGPKITRKEAKKIRTVATKGGITKGFGLKKQTSKLTKGATRFLDRKSTQEQKKSDRIANRQQKKADRIANRQNKRGNKGTSKPDTNRSDEEEQFDDFDVEEYGDDDVMDPVRIKGKNWNPKSVARNVEKQWSNRLDDKSSFTPKRLKINVSGTPKRISRYTNKAGEFETDKYVKNVYKGLAKTAKKRGFKGNALKALNRTGAKMPRERKRPRFGGAINKLKKKLGTVNYRKTIKQTTKKLTKPIKNVNEKKFENVGMSLIKRRSSEDGAVPTVGLTKGKPSNNTNKINKRKNRYPKSPYGKKFSGRGRKKFYKHSGPPLTSATNK